jgi:hypothetical protein
MRRRNTFGVSVGAALIGLAVVSAVRAQELQPQAQPQTQTQPQPAPEVLDGFADIHVHQMANLGFAGSIVWGGAGGDPATTLGPIPPSMRRGHDGVEGATHGHTVPVLFRTLTNAFLGDWFQHNEEGFPGFNSWPSVNRWTHQQVYKVWLFHAYQGGLRLMVMLAVNSEDMFGRGEDEIPLIRYRGCSESGTREGRATIWRRSTGKSARPTSYRKRSTMKMVDQVWVGIASSAIQRRRRESSPKASWPSFSARSCSTCLTVTVIARLVLETQSSRG